jgi:hypothetical protein
MLPKPKHCGENWLAMQPADGGRICGKCTRLIRDFSNASWAEIERVQRENNYSVCGMYAPAQLEHWGQTPAPRKFQLALPLVVATTAVALLHPAPGKVNAQSPAAQFARRDTGEVPAPQPAAQPRLATQFMNFAGKVIDA